MHATGLSRLVENEAKKLVEAALAVAKDIVQANIKVRPLSQGQGYCCTPG